MSENNTENQSFEMIGYQMNFVQGRTEAQKFHLVTSEDQVPETSGISGIDFFDSASFDDALNWVFDEYGDVMRNLAA
jgi:hypothetical protein